MPLSKEMRLLAKNWSSGQQWPRRLDAIEINGIRGWQGQRIEFRFPIVAVVGENGAGKSTILQAAASVYKGKSKTRFASSFFPDTAWDSISKASIRWWVKEGNSYREGSVRKETSRWRGNPDRRERDVEYIDLSRIQPVSARLGYSRLARPQYKEGSSVSFDESRLKRLSDIMGKTYDVASMATTDFDSTRQIPVTTHKGVAYSGFHSGAGETAMVELLINDLRKYSLVIIDEIETSLHPRAQRRLMRDLAQLARVNELQIIVSTHSPYILEELPDDARMYIWEGASGREVMRGVSPSFAMTKMDLEAHPECDVYVEDVDAATMVTEVLAHHAAQAVARCLVIPYGAASVGQSLGQMQKNKRFPRPTRVFLDGDQPASEGCNLLPGGDNPEHVIFEALNNVGWAGLSNRVGRPHSKIVDACQRAMTLEDHHDWVAHAADELVVGGESLWQAMCSVWAEKLASTLDIKAIVDPILEALP